MPDINIQYLDLGKVKGCCTHNEDGSYTIFLNPIFTREQLCKTYMHELKHIIENDFEKLDVNKIEVRKCI